MYFLFLADGFEEIEALATIDVLRRANIKVNSVSIGKNLNSSENKKVEGTNGISVIADLDENEFANILESGNLEGIILPGGMPGTANLNNSEYSIVSAILSSADIGERTATIKLRLSDEKYEESEDGYYRILILNG